MRYLKLYESFENEYSSYIEDIWGVDPEYLKELINHELEDNSLKELSFVFEKDDKHDYFFFEMNTKVDQVCVLDEKTMIEFLTNLEKVEECKAYPVFEQPSKRIIDSEYYETSIYYKNKSGNFYPEIFLKFDEESVLEDGNLGHWCETLNNIFSNANIPYVLDDETSWNEDKFIVYVLYHT